VRNFVEAARRQYKGTVAKARLFLVVQQVPNGK